MKYFLYLVIAILFILGCNKDDGSPTEPENRSPVIQRVTVSPSTIAAEETTNVSCVATDEDGDALTYTWSAQWGSFPNGVSGSSIQWQAPSAAGNYSIAVTVNDGSSTDQKFINVSVEQGNQPPNAPSNPSPAHQATNQSTDVNLSWSCTDSDSDPLTYDVYFGTDANPPRVQQGNNSTSFDPGNLNTNTTYYWKIIARDDHAHSTEGPIWRFTTAPPDNQPPNAPSNPSPAHQATNQSTDVNLSWSCTDSDSDPLTYDVYFGTDATPDNGELVSTVQSPRTYDPGNLNANTTYYWKVVAKDDHAHSTTGSIWRFTTSAQQIQNPTLQASELSPAHPVVNQGGTFTARYQVNNPNQSAVTIILDARWRNQAGRYGELEPTTVEISAPPGTNWLERTCDVPGDMASGVYSFAWYLLLPDNSNIDSSNYIANSFEVTSGGSHAGEERDFPLGDTTIRMCWVPAGSFQMGSPYNEQYPNDDEGPVHRVTFVEGFWLGKYEVTQGQWEAVMGSNPSSEYGVGSNYPVYCVSWTDIQGFESALSNEFRLPSESEWEYACRAGTETRFYWADDGIYSQIGTYAWYENNSSSRTHPVGGKTANAWGLCDMIGNVWEWCEDWYHSDYTNAPSDGSAWTSPSGSQRVSRGGSWDIWAPGCQSTRRIDFRPPLRYGDLGFRLVRSL